MPEICKNCGRELFGGQRFCRFCGRPTDSVPEDNVPTQVMPPDRDPRTGWRQANTAPPQNPETGSVYHPPGYYQPPYSQAPYSQAPYSQGPYPQAPLPPYTPRSRSPWGWVIALVSIGLFAALLLGVFIFSNRRPGRRAGGGPPPPPPPAPPIVAGETVLGEEGARVSGRETVITRSFALGSAAKFSLKNISGDITIEAWDKPQAEVTVTKRGGSAGDRESVQVVSSTEGGNLSLRTAPTRGGNVQVEYEIKLPRNIKQIEINGISSAVVISDVASALLISTQSGSIELRDIKGNVSADTQSGSIEMSQIAGELQANSKSGSIEIRDLDGAARVNTLSGDLRVEFENVTRDKPLTFNSVSGDIELSLKPDINLDLEARTVSGGIELDDGFGLAVNKEVVGRKVSGRIGSGGQPLKVNTVSGDIDIRKRP